MLVAAVSAALITGILIIVGSSAPGGAPLTTGGIQGFAPSTSRFAEPAVFVDVYEYGFQPSNVFIRVGNPVAWRAVGEEPHVITPSSKPGELTFFRAKALGSSRHTFTRPGVFPYHCSIHPQMTGTVTVIDRGQKFPEDEEEEALELD